MLNDTRDDFDHWRESDRQTIDAHRRGASGLLTAHRLAESMEALLNACFARATAARERRDGLTLVALGGLGRRERAPHSDVDILLLHEGRAPTAVVDALLYPLWDAKLDVGHAVRSAFDTLALCERDETVLTAHLDARVIAGNTALFEALAPRLQKIFAVSGRDFVRRRLEPIRERTRAESLVFVLEPDLKEGPGGLRDIHDIEWVLGFRHGTRDFSELVRRGVLSERERRALLASKNFLFRARTALHLLAGRRQDKIVFEHQPALGRELFGDDDVERLLGRHYRHAQEVIDLKHRLFLRIDDEFRSPADRIPKVIDADFSDQQGRLLCTADFSQKPLTLLATFLRALQLERPIADETLDRIAHALDVVDGLQNDSEAHALFWAIVDHPHGDRAFVDMHQTGVLGRFIPEFSRTRALVQADFYHAHTVDVHSLNVLALLYALRRGEGEAEFSVLTQSERSFRSLSLAVLFHDVGKRSGRDHSEFGAELVEKALVRLGAPFDDVEDASLLVREHLLMPKWSQRRDLADPETIREVAERVRDASRLKRLYVLSHVDTLGTGPGLWTPWKASLLRELFLRTSEHLQGREVTERDWGADPAVAAAKAAGGDVWFAPAVHGHERLLLVTRDRPGVLALVASVCTQAKLSIAHADLFSDADGWVRDQFWVRVELAAGLEEEERQQRRAQILEKVQRDLVRALRDGQTIQLDPFKRTPRRGPRPDVEVSLGRQTRTGRIVEITAPDRAGLLADLSRTVFEAGFSIHLARVVTEGARAIDVFYVSEASSEASIEQLAVRLREVARA